MTTEQSVEMSQEDLDVMERLYAKATPGRWVSLQNAHAFRHRHGIESWIVIEGGEFDGEVIAAEDNGCLPAVHNFTLAAMIHNALPALLSMARRTMQSESRMRQAEAENERLRAENHVVIGLLDHQGEILLDCKKQLNDCLRELSEIPESVKITCASMARHEREHPGSDTH